ncbi:MAG: GreA/GreB family elongation factor [Archangium sp.]|nr:GreA/GreB family elongation factor [Archangium sp.]MDP3573771.1 GreA/GreB family elongation factor [Archangium sp.]
MLTQPPITLTRPDFDRLSSLLERAGASVRHLLLDRLEEEVGRASVVEPSKAVGVVSLGHRVVYENLESKQRREVVLVAPEDARAGTEFLSVLSPIGCSLIGLKQGDTFAWDDGPRRWRLQVISVRRD